MKSLLFIPESDINDNLSLQELLLYKTKLKPAKEINFRHKYVTMNNLSFLEIVPKILFTFLSFCTGSILATQTWFLRSLSESILHYNGLIVMSSMMNSDNNGRHIVEYNIVDTGWSWFPVIDQMKRRHSSRPPSIKKQGTFNKGSPFFTFFLK